MIFFGQCFVSAKELVRPPQKILFFHSDFLNLSEKVFYKKLLKKTKALVVAQSDEFKRAARATEIAFGMLATIAGHIQTTAAVSSCICTWVGQAERLPHSTSAGLAELLQGLCFLLGSCDQVRHVFNTLPANPPGKSFFFLYIWSIISMRCEM